jgi:hypothetical protein
MEDYSLRKIYQLNENLSSMQLILPLDFSYALLFGLYMIGGIVLRYNQHQLSIIQYTGYYYTIMTVITFIYLSIYSFIHVFSCSVAPPAFGHNFADLHLVHSDDGTEAKGT